MTIQIDAATIPNVPLEEAVKQAIKESGYEIGALFTQKCRDNSTGILLSIRDPALRGMYYSYRIATLSTCASDTSDGNVWSLKINKDYLNLGKNVRNLLEAIHPLSKAYGARLFVELVRASKIDELEKPIER